MKKLEKVPLPSSKESPCHSEPGRDNETKIRAPVRINLAVHFRLNFPNFPIYECCQFILFYVHFQPAPRVLPPTTTPVEMVAVIAAAMARREASTTWQAPTVSRAAVETVRRRTRWIKDATAEVKSTSARPPPMTARTTGTGRGSCVYACSRPACLTAASLILFFIEERKLVSFRGRILR